LTFIAAIPTIKEMKKNNKGHKFLSRLEELLMNCILRLQENAYTFLIGEKMQKISGKTWAFGAIFTALDRLEKKGYIDSHLGEETPERGGRRKRFYKITPIGFDALAEIRMIDKSMWSDLPDLVADQE